jgi:hypothetical protein
MIRANIEVNSSHFARVTPSPAHVFPSQLAKRPRNRLDFARGRLILTNRAELNTNGGNDLGRVAAIGTGNNR